MVKVPFAGKHFNHRSVGKTHAYDHATLQAALDAIATRADNTEENPYLIEIMADIWDDLDAITVVDLSHIVIIGQGDASILRLTSTAPVGARGGTLTVADDTAVLVEDVTLQNFRLVNNLAGGGAGQGGPPEGALYIGKEAVHPSTKQYDRITVRNMTIEGSHDGLQIFGTNEDFTGTPPFVQVAFNIIRSAHDCYTVKGDVQLISVANQGLVRDAGIPPYIDNVVDWKSTCFHHAVSVGSTGGGVRNAEAYVRSNGDQFSVFTSGKIGGLANQRTVAGVLSYAGAVAAETRPPIKQRWNNTQIHVVNTDTPSDADIHFGGFVFEGASGVDGWNLREDDVVIRGAMIEVDNQADTANIPIVAGVWLELDINTNLLKISGAWIDAKNATTGGNAYALYADDASSTIERADIYSDQGTGGLGTIAALPSV